MMARTQRIKGFTLIEMMVSMGIFVLICGSAFTLLGVSQQRYQSDTQVLNSFQEARLGLDQIVRDVNDSGYPPPNQFELPLPNPSYYAVTPVAWSPNYPISPCAMSGSCTSPNGFEMVVETNQSPQVASSKVQYIRYTLSGTTLYRSMVDKAGQDPTSLSSNTWTSAVPFVQNVMNNAAAAQIAQINASYPGMFPGGAPVPLFRYWCDASTGPQECSTVVGGTPTNIRSVSVTLIVATPTPDAQSGQVRIVELTARGSRLNSFQ
jgi:prepilin-type N-terminal cleavage/methylation domain-containing protein